MKLSRISLALIPLLTAFSTAAAVYQVVELEPNNVSKATFAAAMNDQGNAIVTGQGFIQWRLGNRDQTAVNAVNFINFPLDVSTIDFDTTPVTIILTPQEIEDAKVGIYHSRALDVVTALTPEEIEDAKLGIYDASVLDKLAVRLGARQTLRTQPIGRAVAISQVVNAATAVLPLRDLNQLRSNNEYVYDINEQGVVVGIATAPHSKQDFTPAVDPGDEDAEAPETVTVWQPKPGFQYGVAVTSAGPVNLLPPYTELGGGFSRAFSVNNQNLVAGSGSVGLAEDVYSALETFCDGAGQPQVGCLNVQHQNRVYTYLNLQGQIKTNQTVTSFQNGYHERAMIWQLQADGSATVSQTFGFLGEKGTGEVYQPENNHPTVFYYSTANAINDDGVAVGHSLYSDKNRTIRFRDENTGQEFPRIYVAPHATLYRDGQVTAIIDPVDWLASNAVDINNNGIVTGHAIKTVNGFAQDKFYYYDIATDNVVFPADFFASSSSVPAAINDNGQIVGRGDVIIGGTTTRRQHGFVYDIASDTFRDLNSLVGCNADFTVVDASAINNNGEILATVLQSSPRLDAKGQPLLDDSGNPIMAEQAKAVKLLPIANGEPENCNTEENTYERKAGGFGSVGLLLLAGFGLLLRRRR